MKDYPDWLTVPAQKKFNQLLEHIPNNQQSKAILALLTDVYSNYVSCCDDIKARGLIVGEKQNPSVKLKLELVKTIVVLMNKLKLKENNAVKQIFEEKH